MLYQASLHVTISRCIAAFLDRVNAPHLQYLAVRGGRDSLHSLVLFLVISCSFSCFHFWYVLLLAVESVSIVSAPVDQKHKYAPSSSLCREWDRRGRVTTIAEFPVEKGLRQHHRAVRARCDAGVPRGERNRVVGSLLGMTASLEGKIGEIATTNLLMTR